MLSFLRMLALAFVPACGLAEAGMMGATITVSYNYPTVSAIFAGPYNFIVGPGVEVQCPPDLFFCGTISTPFTLDFTDNQIIYTYNSVFAGYGVAAFNGWVFSDLNMGAPITGVTLSSYGLTGITSSDVSFTSDSVSLNLEGVAESPSSGWTLTLETAPEPATAWTMGGVLGALAAIGIGVRRSKG